MKLWPSCFLCFAATIGTSLAQVPTRVGAHDPNVFVPPVSVENPLLRGLAVHTNYLVYVGPNQPNPIDPQFSLHGPAAFFAAAPFSPAQIRQAYGIPDNGGTGKAIAVVLAYHYKTALNDFNVFARQWGLPAETSTSATASTNKVFQVVYQGTSAPQSNAGWNQEAALDIEWSHSMAPNAKIYLVEANSSSFADMFAAVRKAATLPVQAISMSWGGTEFSGQTSYDSSMVANGKVFFASSGDAGGVKNYPSTSPNAIAVGGTSITIDGSGAISSETGWNGSGGGASSYEGIPSYQSSISGLAGTHRGAPDVSLVADPNTGVYVYDSTRYQGLSGWMQFGGTSLSSPAMAGIYVASGVVSNSTADELSRIYGTYNSAAYSANFADITSGTAGSFACRVGWDFITGVGSPRGTGGF